MNQREKEQYLRDYNVLKGEGKPFFPYIVAKDAIMCAVVMGIIIAMAIVLGRELGPKADPTTTTYVPRPEWYFFFLFEVLRVVKPPQLTPFATIGVPTLAMILLFLLPFYDRSPERRPERRPIATIAGILTILVMAYLTYQGATAGSPTEINMKAPATLTGANLTRWNQGRLVAAQSGCLACHKIGENGNGGPGPQLTHVGAKVGGTAAIAQTLRSPTPPMPSFKNLAATQPQSFSALVYFLGSLK